VVAVRSLLGGLFLLVVLGPRARLLWDAVRNPVSLRTLCIQSALNCIIPWLLVAYAMPSLDAGLASILNSLSPIFIFLLTAFVTKHEPVTRLKAVGVTLGIAGVVAIVGIDAMTAGGGKTLAEIACIAGAISYAIAAVLGVRFANVTPLVPAAGITLIAATVLLPVAFLLERPWTASPSTASVLCVLASAILSTGLAMTIYFRLLSTVGSIAMSSQAYLRILVGVGLGMAFLGEKPTSHAIVGLCLVVAGVVAMTWPAKKAPTP